MIMKTPAPPGAWLATPGATAAKRPQQKVRFDEQAVVASGLGPASVDSSIASEDLQADGSVAIKSSTRTQSPRSSRRIRVLDAFGNEITHSETKEEGTEDDSRSFGKSHRQDWLLSGQRSQQLTEPNVQGSSVIGAVEVGNALVDLKDKDLDRKNALNQLKASIAALKDECNEVDDLLYVNGSLFTSKSSRVMQQY
jgi:hypothetical protein